MRLLKISGMLRLSNDYVNSTAVKCRRLPGRRHGVRSLLTDAYGR